MWGNDANHFVSFSVTQRLNLGGGTLRRALAKIHTWEPLCLPVRWVIKIDFYERRPNPLRNEIDPATD